MNERQRIRLAELANGKWSRGDLRTDRALHRRGLAYVHRELTVITGLGRSWLTRHRLAA